MTASVLSSPTAGNRGGSLVRSGRQREALSYCNTSIRSRLLARRRLAGEQQQPLLPSQIALALFFPETQFAKKAAALLFAATLDFSSASAFAALPIARNELS